MVDELAQNEEDEGHIADIGVVLGVHKQQDCVLREEPEPVGEGEELDLLDHLGAQPPAVGVVPVAPVQQHVLFLGFLGLPSRPSRAQ